MRFNGSSASFLQLKRVQWKNAFGVNSFVVIDAFSWNRCMPNVSYERYMWQSIVSLLFTGTVPPNRNERNEVQDTHYNWHTFIVMMTSQQYSTKDLMRVANYILHVLSDCSSKGVLQERLSNCTVSVTLREAQLINHLVNCQSCVDRLIKLKTQCHLVPGTCRILTIWLTGRQSSVRVKLTLTDGWGFFERSSGYSNS